MASGSCGRQMKEVGEGAVERGRGSELERGVGCGVVQKKLDAGPSDERDVEQRRMPQRA